MSTSKSSEQIVVVGDHVLVFRLDTSDGPRALGVELIVDGARVRGWEEPGWRALGYGVAGGRPFWWSARRLVALDLDPPCVVTEIDCDEDIVCAVGISATSWLIAAETSARLMRKGVEVSRVDFPDVVLRCVPRREGFAFELASGVVATVAVDADHLRALS